MYSIARKSKRDGMYYDIAWTDTLLESLGESSKFKIYDSERKEVKRQSE